MKTLTFEPGAAPPIRLRFLNEDRTPKNTAGATLELRVDMEDAPRVDIPSARDPLTGEFVVDTADVALPARGLAYTAVIYVDWGAGPWRQSQIALKILGSF